LTTNLNRGHSRQASKSSVCSNYSTNSINSTNNSIPHDKNHLRLVFVTQYKEEKKGEISLRNVLNESRHFHNSHSDPNMRANVR
jgi:hypothetical protein